MKIDEEGVKSLGSDHKLIKLSFTRELSTKTGQNDERDQNFYTEKQLETAAKQIEEVISGDDQAQWTYTSLTKQFDLALAKVRKRGRGKRRRKPKSWWDGDVKEAVEKRQEASREHRYAKSNGEPESEVNRKWDTFITCRKEASCLINEKIKRKGAQWLSKVNKKDRKAAKKFWKHLNSLSRKTRLEQHCITTSQGEQLEGDEAAKHVGAMMAEKFKEQRYTENEELEESNLVCENEAIGERE